MTTQTFHILVEQDVQKISSFAYEDMLPEEVDIQANKSFYQLLNDFADLKRVGNRMNDTEARLNDIRTVVVRDTNISVSVVDSNVTVASLPNNYLYLVGIDLSLLYQCSRVPVTLLEPNKFYIVGSGSILINNITYNTGQLVDTSSLAASRSIPKTGMLYRLGQKKVYGRIVTNEDVNYLQDHAFGKTSDKSPVTTVADNKIYIYTDKFFIQDAKITYIRKPNAINITSPNVVIDLPENGAYKLAALTAVNICAITEQAQQKLENIKTQ